MIGPKCGFTDLCLKLPMEKVQLPHLAVFHPQLEMMDPLPDKKSTV